jgi:hypothetical protein
VKYRVGCTITSINTGLSCDIDIGHSRKGDDRWAQAWSRIGGQFDLRDDDGDWMYGSGGSIALVSTALDSDPYWHNPANWLVLLQNVPDRFAEKLGCGEYFLGEGRMFLTDEAIRWKMWYPCV